MGYMSYYLKLSLTLCKLYLVFLIVKFITTPTNPIFRRYFSPPPNSVIINRKEEWEIKKILNSY